MEKSSKFLIPVVKTTYRTISTTSVLQGKRNFRKFPVINKRGPRIFKEMQRLNPHPKIPINKRGVRDTGFVINGQYVEIPEKIPQLIVPDLTNCELKPYVSYRAPEIHQPEFTSLDLFKSVYSEKIIEDFKMGKLMEDGSSLQPSENEVLTAEEAWVKARKTGSDIF